MSTFLPVRAANDKLSRTEARMRSWRERAADQAENVVELGSVAVAGFALGAADAQWGEDAVAGMSTSLAVGLTGAALAVFDVGGRALAPVVKGIAHTGIGVYSYKSGFEMMSRRIREGGGTPGGTAGT
jgi:hypothetical protein